MTLNINSEKININCEEPLSVNALLSHLGYPLSRVSAAIGGTIVKGCDRDNKYLSEGDSVLIVSGAYGG